MLLTRKPPYDTMTDEQFKNAIITDYVRNGYTEEIAKVEADTIIQEEKADREEFMEKIKAASKDLFGEELTEEQIRSKLAAEAISNDKDLTKEQIRKVTDSFLQIMMMLF